jgi:uncharacterized membrane protein YukC
MNANYKQMRDIQKQIDTIYENKSMSGEDKTDRIQKLNKIITEIARGANKRYNAATAAGN